MGDDPEGLPVPRPSSSVLLISPNNEVLLLHRVQTSSAFPSAHVFPGGNVSELHDGWVPSTAAEGRHEDSVVYRNAAIRETFEESGILLARNNGFGRLIEVPEDQREEGRKRIHSNEVTFTKWLSSKGGRADVDGLIPFTRWITPANIPKRYTTQMYLYFLPLAREGEGEVAGAGLGPMPTSSEAMIATPKHDGGIEHTSARFLPASQWLELARKGTVILFPPQFFLLHQIAQFLDTSQTQSAAEMERRRKQLIDYVKRPAGQEDPTWGEAVISPKAVMVQTKDGRVALGLHEPGPELEGSKRSGIKEWVVLTKFSKGGPRQLDVMLRKELFEREREATKL